jgi:hypothetical protein
VQSPVSAIPKSIQKESKKSTSFIYYINQSTSLRHMPGTSPTGLNQAERKRLAAAPCKRGKLHIRRQLERRKSSSHPICRCRSRSPALCQRHQYLLDKRVGHVSFPSKRRKRCISYSGCRRLKQSSEATIKVSRICSEVNTSGRLTPPRSTPLGPHPAQGYHTKATNRN